MQSKLKPQLYNIVLALVQLHIYFSNFIYSYSLTNTFDREDNKIRFTPRKYNINQDLSQENQKLLLVSFDGFRHDYIDKFNAKNLLKLHKIGLRTRWIQDQFVTKTFPNHWSIITGLYEESHGIVSNHFFAPDLNKEFNAFGHPSWKWSWDPKFWNGEPVWKTNEKQGGKSGSFFWVGSEVPINRPNFWFKYNVSVPWEYRVDTVVDWFNTKNVNFATLYVDEPDHSGHEYGPSSVQVKNVVLKVDKLVGYLLDKLPENINLIITSDHGMEDVSREKLILIEDIVPRSMYDKWYGELTHGGIWAGNDKLKVIYNKFKEFNHPHLNVWYRHEIPEYFHLKFNNRVPPLLLVAKEPYQVARTLREATLKGEHGYSNKNMNMHPIFLAKGPKFINEPDKLMDPFDSVDIYPLMCEILNIQPAPNNGSICEVSHLLKNGVTGCSEKANVRQLITQENNSFFKIFSKIIVDRYNNLTSVFLQIFRFFSTNS